MEYDPRAEEYGEYKELKGSLYGELMDRAIRELDRSVLFQSEHFHGEDHIERTIVLGAYVAKGEGFTPAETELLLLCCAYHDIGRINDRLDDEHGSRAAEKIMRGEVRALNAVSAEERAIAAAAISVHSQSDTTAPAYEKLYGIEDHELYMKMMCSLKDADNLDRVRLRDLDTKHLRSATAHRGVDFAENLLKIIPPPMEPYWLHKKAEENSAH